MKFSELIADDLSSTPIGRDASLSCYCCRLVDLPDWNNLNCSLRMLVWANISPVYPQVRFPIYNFTWGDRI